MQISYVYVFIKVQYPMFINIQSGLIIIHTKIGVSTHGRNRNALQYFE